VHDDLGELDAAVQTPSSNNFRIEFEGLAHDLARTTTPTATSAVSP
jgi:hypothetical protein